MPVYGNLFAFFLVYFYFTFNVESNDDAERRKQAVQEIISFLLNVLRVSKGSSNFFPPTNLSGIAHTNSSHPLVKGSQIFSATFSSAFVKFIFCWPPECMGIVGHERATLPPKVLLPSQNQPKLLPAKSDLAHVSS